MDLQERQKARNELNNTTAVASPVKVSRRALERVEDSGALTYEEIAQRVEDAFCEWSNNNGVRNWTQETQRRFSAVCLYIGENVFKPIKKDVLLNTVIRQTENNPIASTGFKYDIDSLEIYYDIFLGYAVRCDKCPTRWAFQWFCGLTHDYLNKMGKRENLTPSENEFLKKVLQNEEQTNFDGLLGGKQNVVGIIFAGKNLYGWKDAKEVHQVTETRRNLDEIAQSMGVGLPVDTNGGVE